MKKILLINGVNFEILEKREHSYYGGASVRSIEKLVCNTAIGLEATCFQSSIEGEICKAIHAAIDPEFVGIIINAGAYTHTSIAILDALSAVKSINQNIIICEVHLSNIYKREEFRHKSYVSKVADTVICGMGVDGYRYSVDYINKRSV